MQMQTRMELVTEIRLPFATTPDPSRWASWVDTHPVTVLLYLPVLVSFARTLKTHLSHGIRCIVAYAPAETRLSCHEARRAHS